jgi:type IV secretion system protein VirB10
MFVRAISTVMLAGVTLFGQTGVAPETPRPADKASPVDPQDRDYLVDVGTRIPLSMINSVSTKNSAPGDRVYLETTFPIVVDGRIVIPAGSYVMGTITDAKRAGRVKGKAEFRLRFDSLTLPNGVTRDFRATVAGLDGRAKESLDRKEGVVRSEGNKGGDAQTVATGTIYGASGGGLVGLATGSAARGAGIGAAAGATAALVGILVTRGPDAVLARGTTVEMVLDRQVTYADSELNFSNSGGTRRVSNDANSGPQGNSRQALPNPAGFPRRLP